MAFIHSIWTVILLIVFLGIVLWAYSGHRKTAFEEAARLPLEDDHPHIPSTREHNDG